MRGRGSLALIFTYTNNGGRDYEYGWEPIFTIYTQQFLRCKYSAGI